MGWTNTAAVGGGVDELLHRFVRVAHRIQDADYIGAMQSLRYWDAGYDLGPLPREVLNRLHDHSKAARVCLTSGDAGGASSHVQLALELATSTRAPLVVEQSPVPEPVVVVQGITPQEPPRVVRATRSRGRRQPSNSPS